MVDMQRERLMLRVFMMWGVLAPLPEPGAPFSQMISRGTPKFCGGRRG
jgi:hypothetical protein